VHGRHLSKAEVNANVFQLLFKSGHAVNRMVGLLEADYKAFDPLNEKAHQF